MTVIESLTMEQAEELFGLIGRQGYSTILKVMDEVIENMRHAVLTTPLPTDPQAAAIAVYAARMKAEGAMDLRRALSGKLGSFVKEMIKIEKLKEEAKK